LAVTLAGALAVGVGAGWLIATRLIFPSPPPPGDLYVVPDLYGVELDDATRRVEGAGLALGPVDSFRHPSVDSGRVIGQDPLPGQLAAPGRVVRISVSLGVDRRTIPEVSHLRGDRAQQRLEGAGFVVIVDSVQSDDPRGRVVSIDPPAGTPLAAPGEVRLQVSIGPPQVAMPSLLGMPEAQARDTLLALGFTLTRVDDQYGFVEEEGRVVGQNPPPEQTLDRGSAVTIVIGRRGQRPDTIQSTPEVLGRGNKRGLRP
jgi:serine/threonine-protein kinase